MPLHFTLEELAARRAKTAAELAARGLDGLLMFRQESMYYLTGYDSTGFITFQCLYFGVDGRLSLLTRSPDLRQSRYSSMIEDVRIWVDGAEANPAVDLRAILEEHGCRGKRLGVEYNAFGLNAAQARLVDRAMEGFCELVDASDLVSRQRLVKSDAELVYVRKAAELADEALGEAHRIIEPGATEGELYAAMHGAIFRGGGFYPASRFAIGSGKKALLVRTTSDTGVIGENDQVQLEFGAAYRHYHSCLMRTVLTGRVAPRQRAMYDASAEALVACKEVCRPGNTVGQIFDAHAGVYDAAGFRPHRLNACGYSLGATWAPSWMDWPMIHTGNPVILEPNMVFFLLMIVLDSDAGLAMSLGQTVLVAENGCETLSKMPLDLVVK